MRDRWINGEMDGQIDDDLSNIYLTMHKTEQENINMTCRLHQQERALTMALRSWTSRSLKLKVLIFITLTFFMYHKWINKIKNDGEIILKYQLKSLDLRLFHDLGACMDKEWKRYYMYQNNMQGILVEKKRIKLELSFWD